MPAVAAGTRALALAIVVHAAVVRADSSVTVTLTPQGQALAASFGDSEQAFIQKAVDAINNQYQTLRLTQVLDALMTTAAFANSALGVDYAVKPGEHMVGVVVDGVLASDTSIATPERITTNALVNVSVMAGWNLAHYHHPRWTVFANAGYLPGSLNVLDGHLITGGAHVQYRAIESSARGKVQWLGVDITTGGELARRELGNSAPVVTHFTLHANTGTASWSVTMTATGSLSLVATTFTVPIEATTGVRFGDTFAMFAGGGLDVIAGSATATIGLNGNLTGEADGQPLGTAAISATGHESASPVTVHALAGMQLNVPYVHLYLQGVVTPSVYAAVFGVRAAW